MPATILIAATGPQRDYLRDLYGQRELPAVPADALQAEAIQLVTDWIAGDRQLARDEASELIDFMRGLPRKRPASAPAAGAGLRDVEEDQGVYALGDDVYIAKLSRAGHMYAMRLVQATGDRLSEAGTVLAFDREYAPGVVKRLTTADRMKLEDARELMTRYGRCLYCGRSLRAAASVGRMVGPVCAKRFAA